MDEIQAKVLYVQPELEFEGRADGVVLMDDFG
jgi:hypothetical protein